MTLNLKRAIQMADPKRAIVVGVVGLVVFVILAEWLIWLMPKPHGRLQYMVAGTAATAAALGTVFTRVAVRRALWASRQRQ